MTEAADIFRATLERVPETFTITRDLLTTLVATIDAGASVTQAVSAELVGAVYALEKRVIALEGDEGSIMGGGIQVFDPDDLPRT